MSLGFMLEAQNKGNKSMWVSSFKFASLQPACKIHLAAKKKIKKKVSILKLNDRLDLSFPDQPLVRHTITYVGTEKNHKHGFHVLTKPDASVFLFDERGEVVRRYIEGNGTEERPYIIKLLDYQGFVVGNVRITVESSRTSGQRTRLSFKCPKWMERSEVRKS